MTGAYVGLAVLVGAVIGAALARRVGRGRADVSRISLRLDVERQRREDGGRRR